MFDYFGEILLVSHNDGKKNIYIYIHTYIPRSIAITTEDSDKSFLPKKQVSYKSIVGPTLDLGMRSWDDKIPKPVLSPSYHIFLDITVGNGKVVAQKKITCLMNF